MSKRLSGRSLFLLVIGGVLAIPTHIWVWTWFISSGPELIGSVSASIVSDPGWLTSIFYFPITLIVVVASEFVALLPLNIVIGVFALWRKYVRHETPGQHTVRL